MVSNGRVPLTQLTAVFPGAYLLNPVAVSVKTLIRVGALEGTKITPAGKFAPAYRDISAQTLYKNASRGDKAAITRLRGLGSVIDPRMVTNVGNVGFQSHGNADRIDLLFNGRSPSDADLALARRYGGVQEFGDDDRNHFWFGPSHSGVAEADKNRIVAAFLNEHDLGKTTSTEKDGVWPAESNMSWLLQR